MNSDLKKSTQLKSTKLVEFYLEMDINPVYLSPSHTYELNRNNHACFPRM